MTANKRDDRHEAEYVEQDLNEDPISGAHGAHPVGTGVGTAAGGAAAGAAVGALGGGPIGAAIGVLVGGIAGGLAGKAVAEQVDPTVEHAYWKDEFRNRPYYEEDVVYEETYAPAYEKGWESRSEYEDRTFEEVEPELRKNWEGSSHSDKLAWDKAKLATRDAWDRADRTVTTYRDNDQYWRDEYKNRSYFDDTVEYDTTYAPAYRAGCEYRSRYAGQTFEEVEPEIRRDWESRPHADDLTWDKAKLAIRDAWHRVERALPGDADNDGR